MDGVDCGNLNQSRHAPQLTPGGTTTPDDATTPGATMTPGDTTSEISTPPKPTDTAVPEQTDEPAAKPEREKVTPAMPLTTDSTRELWSIYLFIYSISFNVIQPMWICRQIPKQKIGDILKCRNQTNKQNKTQEHMKHKRNPPLSAVGCTHSGDEAPLVKSTYHKQQCN
jgi:hypothetical protein